MYEDDVKLIPCISYEIDLCLAMCYLRWKLVYLMGSFELNYFHQRFAGIDICFQTNEPAIFPQTLVRKCAKYKDNLLC